MELLTEGDNHRCLIAAIGMFDGVHAGHRFLLGQLKEEAARRGLGTAAVTFSNHPLQVVAPSRAPRLLSTPGEKLGLLASQGVDCCVMLEFDEGLRRLTAREFMMMLRERYGVRALMLGFNNNFGSDRGLSVDDYIRIGSETGVEVVLAVELPSGEEHVSSSAIRRLVASCDVETASRYLGRDYSLTGEVVAGKQLGRTIGFPTANLQPSDSVKIIPGNGVYAARAVTADAKVYPAMVNIGHRPTVDAPDAPVSIEAHLAGLDHDIYGEEMRLEFIKFLRHEQRFNSVEELKAQLSRDLAATTTAVTRR